MNDTQLGPLEQLIRMGMNAGGAAIFGQAVTQGDLYQGAIGGVISLIAFAWWYIRNRRVTGNQFAQRLRG